MKRITCFWRKVKLHSSEQLGLVKLSNVETTVAMRDFSSANEKFLIKILCRKHVLNDIVILFEMSLNHMFCMQSDSFLFLCVVKMGGFTQHISTLKYISFFQYQQCPLFVELFSIQCYMCYTVIL